MTKHHPPPPTLTFILTIPFILRTGSSQLALTLQELVPEELLGFIHQSVVDEHLHSVHGIELLVGRGGGDTRKKKLLRSWLALPNSSQDRRESGRST